MRNDTSTMDLVREPVDVAPLELDQSAIDQPTTELPTLDSIIRHICRDAENDSVRFALRSDVGLDGE